MKPSVFTRVASFIPWIKEVSVGRLESMLYCIIADKQGITWQYHYVQIYDNPLVFLLLDHGQQLRIDYTVKLLYPHHLSGLDYETNED